MREMVGDTEKTDLDLKETGQQKLNLELSQNYYTTRYSKLFPQI